MATVTKDFRLKAGLVVEGSTATVNGKNVITAGIVDAKGDLIVGNIKQSKLFHYIEKDFVTPKLIQRLEELVNGKV